MSVTEEYLKALAEGDTSNLPVPKNNIDFYLAKMCGVYNGELPEPKCVVDEYLKYIAENGSGGGSGSGGGESLLIEDMSYFFYTGVRMEQFDEITEKLAPYASIMKYMCKDNTVLETVDMDVSSCTDAQEMFYNCTALTSAVLKNTNKIQNAPSMFYNCKNLQSITLGNTGNMQNMSNMFNTCSALENHPALDMTSCTNAGYLFNKCATLKKISNIVAPICTNMTYLCYSCSNLETLENVSASSCKDASLLLQNCTALKKIDGLLFPQATNCASMFRYDTALEEILNIDLSSCSGNGSSFNYGFGTCSALKRLVWSADATAVPKYSIANCSFDREGMIEMFNSLPEGGKNASFNSVSITITGNPCCNGTEGYDQLTEEDLAIATDKGYTIVTT